MKKKVILSTVFVFLLCFFSTAVFAVDVLELKEGEIFEISLLENSSTGYFWHLADQDAAYSILKTETELLNTDKNMAGSPGIKTWIIEAEAQGVSELNFKLHRKGSPDNVVEEQQYLLAVETPIIRVGTNEIKKINLLTEVGNYCSWQIEQNDLIDLIKEETLQLADNKSLKSFYFQTNKTGWTRLELKLYQSWKEKELKTVKSYLIVGN